MIPPLDSSFRIETLRVRLLELPLKIPFRISGGVCRARRSAIVELRSEGLVGYGEAAPFDEPFYSEETIGSVLALYRDLYLTRLEGQQFRSLDDFDCELRRGVRGNPMARAGLETAAWDLVSRRRGLSLSQLAGSWLRARGLPEEACRPRPRIESGVAIGIPSVPPAERRTLLKSWIEGYCREGYRRVKLKIVPGWDREPCELARQALGPEYPISTDANASYSLEAHAEALEGLDRFGLIFHEQPLAAGDLLDHAKLARRLRTPICLDESLSSLAAARAALECGASRIWNLKVQRLGGLCEALRVYELATRTGGIALWAGTMPESGIGTQASLALAALPAMAYPSDIEPSSRWFADGADPIETQMAADGTIAVPEAAGLETLFERRRYERFARPQL